MSITSGRGSQPDDTAATDPSGTVLQLATMEADVESIPAGLRRCDQCGELRGLGLFSNGFVRISCLCDGIVCRRCRSGVVRRPISDYYDETRGCVVHVPWFNYLRPCDRCRV